MKTSTTGKLRRVCNVGKHHVGKTSSRESGSDRTYARANYGAQTIPRTKSFAKSHFSSNGFFLRRTLNNSLHSIAI